MVQFGSAKKITDTPFPFPYAQMLALLLQLNVLVTPIVMCAWTDHWLWAGACTFITVFSVWCINFISTELEQPFGDDTNDLPTRDLQVEMNKLLLLLLDPRTNRIPHLNNNAVKDLRSLCCDTDVFDSFKQAVGADNPEDPISPGFTKARARSTLSEMQSLWSTFDDESTKPTTLENSVEPKPPQQSHEVAKSNLSTSVGETLTRTTDEGTPSINLSMQVESKSSERNKMEMLGTDLHDAVIAYIDEADAFTPPEFPRENPLRQNSVGCPGPVCADTLIDQSRRPQIFV
eukprot:gnl/MRDRNA2_/MRDRNA2_202659_c0_seq1.p1 gnl/MRDRNA2_/MRDRNA2_202659_c0~~gnl/MRDRNA2_/MRDRNA2_202659_c0_seq1.p1  ORF type:complete len:331 (+),score=46.69 gnl/MRDRNA2_/MRDRNA2_202659_c0_seq1:127-993(+)